MAEKRTYVRGSAREDRYTEKYCVVAAPLVQLPSSRAIRLSRAKDNITGALKRIMIFFKQDTSFQIRLKRVYYTFRKSKPRRACAVKNG